MIFVRFIKRALTVVLSAAVATGSLPVLAETDEAADVQSTEIQDVQSTDVPEPDIIETDDVYVSTDAFYEDEPLVGAAASGMYTLTMDTDPSGNPTRDENGYITSTYGYTLKGDPYNIKQVKQGTEYSAGNKKLHDPYWLNDENLFGRWDGSKWAVKPKLDYDNYEELSDVADAAKAGDYETAKLQLYNYYILKERALNRAKSTTSSKKDDITADLLMKNFMYNDRSGVIPAELINVGNTPSYVSGDITSIITKYLGIRKYLTFWVMATDKNGDSAVFNSKEAGENIPYLKIKVNGTDKVIYPTEDSMIKAGDNKKKNYGSDSELVAHEDGIEETKTLVNSETSRIYIKFDVSELVKGDTVSAATFNIYGHNMTEGKEKEVVLFYSDDSSWTEKEITYAGATAQVAFSYDQSDSWEWNQPTNAGYRYQEELLRFDTWFDKLVKMYNVTGDEKYAYTALRLFMDYLYVRGDDPCWLKSLDVAVRSQIMPSYVMQLIESEYMNPDIFTGIIKWMYVQGYCASFFTRGTNWGLSETWGLFTIAINFPEFSASQSWIDRVKIRYENLSESMIKDDFSCTELSLGYTDYTIATTVGAKDAADEIGYEEYPYTQKTIDNIEGWGLFEYYTSMPGVRDNQVGDGYSYRGNFKSRMMYLGQWLGNDELMYAATDGKNGTPPSFTSKLFPDGKKAIMRTGWGDNDMYLFMDADGGVGTHSHPDDNAVVVMAHGQYLLVDPLYGTYSGSAIADWLTSTKAHNLVTVNGASQAYNKSAAVGKIDRWETNNSYDFSTMDSPATPGISSYKRSILFIRNNFWLVNDYLVPDSTKTNTYVQSWHYLPEADPSMDSETKTSRTNMPEVNIQVVPVKPEDFSGSRLADGYYSEGQGSILSAKYTEYEKKQAGTAVFNTVLMPENRGEDYDIITSPINVEGMSDTDASAYEIYMTDKNTGKISHYQYYLLHNSSKKTTVQIDNHKTDASMLFVELNDDGSTKYAIAQDASFIQDTLKNSYVFKNDEPVSEISVELSGNICSIDSSAVTVDNLKNGNAEVSACGKTITKVLLNSTETAYKQVGDILYFGDAPSGETPSPTPTIKPTSAPVHAGGSGGGGGGGAAPSRTPVPSASQTPLPTVSPDDNPQASSEPQEMSDGMKKEIDGHWAEKEIRTLYNSGIIKGNNDGLLALDDNITRAEFVTLLVRAKNIDISEYSGVFSDVSQDDWYAGYIQAAYDNGIMRGSDGRAEPSKNITREEMAVMLSSLLDGESADVDFSDSTEISSWAEEAVKKVCSSGLMNGRGDNMFAPKENTKRSEAFAVVYRLLNN